MIGGDSGKVGARPRGTRVESPWQDEDNLEMFAPLPWLSEY